MKSKREQCKSCKMGCSQEIFQVKLNKGRIPFDKCFDFTPKQTNADRIRAMSDEELADFLECVETAGYNDSSIAPKGENGFPMDMLQWLKSEVKELEDGCADGSRTGVEQ